MSKQLTETTISVTKKVTTTVMISETKTETPDFSFKTFHIHCKNC